jgi:hypothetical protein
MQAANNNSAASFNIKNLSLAIQDLIKLLEMESALLKSPTPSKISALLQKKDELLKYIEAQKRIIAAGAIIEEKDKATLTELAQKLHVTSELNRAEVEKSIYAVNELVSAIYEKVAVQSSVAQYGKDGVKSKKALEIDPPAISINEAI